MEKLLSNRLIFGNLYRVSGATMVGRYNACLRAMGIAPTDLEEFHVDASGYSPEIADEKGDKQYLDPEGVNRHFIILSPEQRSLPIVKMHFSADITVLRRFMDANMPSIERVTLSDAIYGEMENLVVSVKRPADIVDFKTVEFVVHTPSGILEASEDLRAMVAVFEQDDMAWRVPGFLEGMLEKVLVCGDVRRNGLVCQHRKFEWPNVFWTDHFGGAYVFRSDGSMTAPETRMFFRRQVPESMKDHILGHSLSDSAAAIEVLEERRFLDDLNVDSLSDDILHHKLSMRVAHVLLKNGVPFDNQAVVSEKSMNSIMYANLGILNEDPIYVYLTEMRKIAASGGDVHSFDVDADTLARFSVRRALPDIEDVWEINRFVGEYCEWDVVSLFAVNKVRFYEIYAGMSDRAKEFALGAIRSIYDDGGGNALRMKNGFRMKLFGHTN